jgi:hypothetical protein
MTIATADILGTSVGDPDPEPDPQDPHVLDLLDLQLRILPFSHKCVKQTEII